MKLLITMLDDLVRKKKGPRYENIEISVPEVVCIAIMFFSSEFKLIANLTISKRVHSLGA